MKVCIGENVKELCQIRPSHPSNPALCFQKHPSEDFYKQGMKGVTGHAVAWSQHLIYKYQSSVGLVRGAESLLSLIASAASSAQSFFSADTLFLAQLLL